ncbi:PREDICTED: steroidogenic factor 1 [Pygoscelis adeliae]|uniref:steroidogenic factor 1 n=1 Tax=Pygoscelis adeliae TaxID=9238 RepID=UPI0004F50B29|nr:PREDICTED: steroidogenic factor 1 [Pygoscelis adeliae]
MEALVLLCTGSLQPLPSLCPPAVRADRMRGGRNKFGPMYKRDRALKQQKKALIRANGFKLETVPQIMSPVQNDYSLSSTIHSIHAMSKTLPPNPAALTPVDYERNPYGTPSLGMTVPSHAPLAGYHYSSFPNRTIKSEYPDHYTNAHESMPAYVYPETYPSSSPPDIPEVILKLLQLEPDEAQVKARILACLQQEQGKGRHEKLSTFGLMCKMADQTLLSIVEWARSCIFFKELEVGDHVLLLQGCFAESWLLPRASQGAWRGGSKPSGAWGPTGSRLARTSLCSLPRESGSWSPLELATFTFDAPNSRSALWAGAQLLPCARSPAAGLQGLALPRLMPSPSLQVDMSTVAAQAGSILNTLVLRAQELILHLHSLQVDRQGVLRLNAVQMGQTRGFGSVSLSHPRLADVKYLENHTLAKDAQEKANAALLEETGCHYPHSTDKFRQLLLRLAEVRALLDAEEHVCLCFSTCLCIFLLKSVVQFHLLFVNLKNWRKWFGR